MGGEERWWVCVGESLSRPKPTSEGSRLGVGSIADGEVQRYEPRCEGAHEVREEFDHFIAWSAMGNARGVLVLGVSCVFTGRVWCRCR